MVSVRLNGDFQQVTRFMQALKVFSLAKAWVVLSHLPTILKQ